MLKAIAKWLFIRTHGKSITRANLRAHDYAKRDWRWREGATQTLRTLGLELVDE